MRGELGFTVIELVAIMVLLGILSVYAVPKMTGTGDFDRHAARNQILAAAHLAQQRALYDSSADFSTADQCYRFTIQSRRVFVLDPTGQPVGPDQDWRNGLELSGDYALADISRAFDRLGNVMSACNGAPVDTEIDLGSAIKACFSEVGYIRAC